MYNNKQRQAIYALRTGATNICEVIETDISNDNNM